MINYPPIDELAQKTGSKYALCVIASKRARQLIDGEMPLVKAKKGEKPLSIAIQEMNEGKLTIVTDNAEEEE